MSFFNKKKWLNARDPFEKENANRMKEAPTYYMENKLRDVSLDIQHNEIYGDKGTKYNQHINRGFGMEKGKEVYQEAKRRINAKFDKEFRNWLVGRYEMTMLEKQRAALNGYVDPLDYNNKTSDNEQIKKYIVDPIKKRYQFIVKLIKLSQRGPTGFKSLNDAWLYFKYLTRRRKNIDKIDYMSIVEDPEEVKDKEGKVTIKNNTLIPPTMDQPLKDNQSKIIEQDRVKLVTPKKLTDEDIKLIKAERQKEVEAIQKKLGEMEDKYNKLLKKQEEEEEKRKNDLNERFTKIIEEQKQKKLQEEKEEQERLKKQQEKEEEERKKREEEQNKLKQQQLQEQQNKENAEQQNNDNQQKQDDELMEDLNEQNKQEPAVNVNKNTVNKEAAEEDEELDENISEERFLSKLNESIDQADKVLEEIESSKTVATPTKTPTITTKEVLKNMTDSAKKAKKLFEQIQSKQKVKNIPEKQNITATDTTTPIIRSRRKGRVPEITKRMKVTAGRRAAQKKRGAQKSKEQLQGKRKKDK